ncbi:hypothetical protein NIES4106_61520 (plasmid) [Fischerella sp. NIES-4106]|nr:hypothetical protein NIES4106_61520 [Fischerella sp. NIES-4106]
MITSLAATPITGKEALNRQLRRQGFYPGSEIWVKVNNNNIYSGIITPEGFSLWRMIKAKDANGNDLPDPKGGSVWEKSTKYYQDGYDHLLRRARCGDEIFFLPLHPHGGIGSGHATKLDQLFIECDDRPIPEQWEKINEIRQTLGLVPSAVVFSGGKSLHIYYKLNENLDPESWQRLQRKLIILFSSDPVIQNPNREMRLSGFPRTKKNSEQTLEFESDYVFTAQEIETALDSTGKFLYGLSNNRWTKWRSEALKRKQKIQIEPDAVLFLPEEKLYPKKNFHYTSDDNFSDREDIDAIILEALNYIPPRQIGTGNYQEAITVLMALVAHYGPDRAEAIAEQWSPSIRGSSWDIRRKIRSFKRSGIEIGSLFFIAQSYGFKIPPKVKEIDQNQRIKKLADRNLELIEKAQADYDSLRQSLNKLLRQPKRIVEAVPVPQKAKKNIKLARFDGTVPTQEQYKSAGNPTIVFKAGDRKEIYQKLIEQGYKIVLDTTHAGAGKSHVAGEMQPGDFGVEQLFYISDNHRNPTTLTLEDWEDLPARHNGLISDPSQQTPSGKDHIRWPKQGETPDIQGNCHRAYLFHALAKKGYQAEIDKESSVNPICGTCKLRAACAGRDFSGKETERVEGASFRRDRAGALAAPRIRAHINSVPLFEDQAKRGAFIDEVEKQINSIDVTEVTLADFDRTLMDFQSKLPEVWEQIKTLILPLRSILSGESEITQETYHGWSDQALRSILGKIDPEIIEEAIANLTENAPDLKTLIRETDSVSLDGFSSKDRKGISRDTLKYIRAAMQSEANRESWENIDNLPSNWLLRYLEVLLQVIPGAIRTKGRKLIISTKNIRQAEIIKQFDFTVLMDATADREHVALQLGIDPSEIVLIREERPDYSNLTIHQITGMGLLGKQRSESMNSRVSALRSHLKHQHADIAFIDHLATKEEGDGHWFRDNRGSNQYQGVSAICAFGTPFADLGATQHAYMISTGEKYIERDDPKFAGFVDHLVQSELIQYAGRPRSNRRNDKITVYLVTEADLNFLKGYYPGATLIKTDAFKVCPESGSESQQTRWAIWNAGHKLFQQGAKITQQAIADSACLAQGTISKIASTFGGWKTYQKLFQVLPSSLYRGWNNSENNLDPETQWILSEYLPLLATNKELSDLEAVQNICEVIESLGETVFHKVLEIIPTSIRHALFRRMLAIFPDIITQDSILYSLFDDIGRLYTPQAL